MLTKARFGRVKGVRVERQIHRNDVFHSAGTRLPVRGWRNGCADARSRLVIDRAWSRAALAAKPKAALEALKAFEEEAGKAMAALSIWGLLIRSIYSSVILGAALFVATLSTTPGTMFLSSLANPVPCAMALPSGNGSCQPRWKRSASD